jgi:NHL repeat
MIARGSLLRMLVLLCAVACGLLSIWSVPALAQREHVFSQSFGSEGSGDGQFSGPGGLAVNESTGDVYVIDRGNGRVEIFSAVGAYEGQFNGSASPTGVFSWPDTEVSEHGRVLPEGAIAVDNSTDPHDPSKGDVYVADNGHGVIDKFSSSGAYIGQVTGTSPTSRFPNLSIEPSAAESTIGGIAVDPNGTLWVQVGQVSDVIDRFNDALANEYVSFVKLKARAGGEDLGGAGVPGAMNFAFDSEGNFYIGLKLALFPLVTPTEFSQTGEVLAEKLDDEETTGFAVDLSSEDVYVDHETSVAAYSPSGFPVERFGSAQMQASEGIAVNSATGTVYTANAGSQEVDVFAAVVVPDASTGSVSSFAETSVTVNGVVNPDGLPVTSCAFEYGTSTAYGQSVPCFPSLGSGSAPVTVSAQLTGLERLTKYHFRLNVSNANGSNPGQDRTFVTPEPVAFSEESVSDVSSASALFSVQVDPGGADTTYVFEYGTSVSYGESVPAPAGDLGAGTSSEPVSVRAQDLLGETTYHVRVVASNVLGTVYGPDQTFTTQAGGGAFMLPDGREWEMVSPPDKEGSLIEPIGGGLSDEGLIESAADGGAISYYANGPLGAGVAGNPNPFGLAQVLSRRGAGGWSSEDIDVPLKAAGEDSQPEYRFFSPDLSRAIVRTFGSALLSPEATEQTPYLRDDGSGSYEPLVNAGNVVPPGAAFGPPQSSEDPLPIAVTPDLAHVLFTSPYALTANALDLPTARNIYEWSEGRLQLVSVLPNERADERPQLGGGDGQDTRHALSNDGSRVFFEEANGSGRGALNMRDTVTGHTVRVDAPAPGVAQPPGEGRAEFEIASADGSRVFFLDDESLTLDSKLKPAPGGGGPSDLYVYDTVTGVLTDLSVDQNVGEQANVQDEVVGASEEGSIVYFVATGALAEGAEAGKDNLYVESLTGSTWSPPRLVAVLSAGDGNDWASDHPEAVFLTSRVSPSGRYLAFMSDRSLTGYDNRDANSAQPDEEVFLYDEATGRLRCVSCDPTGARPDGILDQGQSGGHETMLLVDSGGPPLWEGRWLAASIPGWTRVENAGGAGVYYQSRVLSDEGRMFFDSADALVPQDTNGREDVYEYEPQGVGSCARSGDCVSLLSSGTSAEESAFLDASEGGNDVFFLTASRLVARDVDTSQDVYDAHVCSAAAPCASVPVSPPPCTSGDSCKAAPSPQPAIFGAPASATFSGAGNVTSSEAAGSGAAPKRAAKKKPAHRKRKRKPRRRSKGRKSSRARKSLSTGARR